MTDVKPSYYYYMTDNVKLVNKHRVCCFNATASLYVGHAIFYLARKVNKLKYNKVISKNKFS
jgi:sugar phosphate permease